MAAAVKARYSWMTGKRKNSIARVWIKKGEGKIFINGKLYRSKFLKGIPILEKGTLKICPYGGFNGLISQFIYMNRRIKLKEIIRNLKKGHS